MLHKLLRSARTQFNRPIQVIWERPRRLRVYCMGRRMPSWEVFDRQDKDYRDGVLPPRVKARDGRASLTIGVGTLPGLGRWHHWHEDFWNSGVSQETSKKVRFRAELGRCGRQAEGIGYATY